MKPSFYITRNTIGNLLYPLSILLNTTSTPHIIPNPISPPLPLAYFLTPSTTKMSNLMVQTRVHLSVSFVKNVVMMLRNALNYSLTFVLNVQLQIMLLHSLLAHNLGLLILVPLIMLPLNSLICLCINLMKVLMIL